MSKKKKCILAALLTLVFLGLVEVGLRVAGVATLTPEEQRTRAYHDTFYTFDPDLLYRMPPGLKTNFSILYPELDVPVDLNSRGYRGPEFERDRGGRFRIVCLGDSVTFGWAVRLEDTYPRLLEGLLSEGGLAVEVINLGVPSYTAFEGRRLVPGEVASLDPDVVIIGYGFNDSFIKTFTEEEGVALMKRRTIFPGSLLVGAADWIGTLCLFRLLASALPGDGDQKPFDHVEGLTERVPAGMYRDCLRDMVKTLGDRTDAEVLLLNLDFPNRYPSQVLEEVSADTGVVYRNLREHFLVACGAPIDPPVPAGPDGQKKKVRIRMSVPGFRVESPEAEREHRVYAVWVPDPTRRLAFEQIRLRDHGSEGDEAALDGTWSAVADVALKGEIAFRAEGYFAAFESPMLFLNSYYFHGLVLEGGKVEGMHDRDDPSDDDSTTGGKAADEGTDSLSADVASLGIPSTPIYPLNTCPFKRWMVDFDDIHPNPEGYERIAREVARLIRDTEAWRKRGW